MTSDFCASLSPSAVHNWAKLSDNGDEDIRVSTRKNMANPEFPGRVVICAATSFWLPVTPQKSFDFLQDLKRRNQVNDLFFTQYLIDRIDPVISFYIILRYIAVKDFPSLIFQDQ